MQDTPSETKIKIACEVTETLQISEMLEFQGELKTRTDEDYEKILSSIYVHGIAFPFFVWRDGAHNYILDGHGRYEALCRASESGVEIPSLPVVYINANDEKQAKNLLLRLNSRYGRITLGGVRGFIDGADIDLSTVSLPDLPSLADQLNEIVKELPSVHEDEDDEKPAFNLYCPECGEKHHVTDDELREVIDGED